MNIIYEFIAKKLNDWENHETELDYNNYLSIKLFLFKFVNSYISLFYICFLKKIIEEEGCFKENCMLELSI